MSNTERIHRRFWSAMAERYGRRWSDQYGPEASAAWRELIDRYSPDDVKGALAMLKSEAPDHPPTQPQFEALLAKSVQRSRGDGIDWRRAYWRSTVIAEVRHACTGRPGWPQTASEFEDFATAHRETLGVPMRELLDELCELELRTGQRTQGMDDHVRKSAARIVREFQRQPVTETLF